MNNEQIISMARFLEWYSYHPQYILSNDSFPQWMKYECSINEPYIYHCQMIEQGFLESCTALENLQRLTIKALKEIATVNGFSVKGKKQEIISAICENININNLDLPKHYKLTPKGLSFIEENHEALQAVKLKRYNITINEYYSQKAAMPINTGINEIASNILNAKRIEYTAEEQYGHLRNNYYNMADFCKSEQNNNEAHKYCCDAISAELEALKKGGCDKYKIVAILDDRTCDKCSSLDGKIFKISEAVTGINLPPFHEGCRCFIVIAPRTEEEIQADSKRVEEIKKKMHLDMPSQSQILCKREIVQ